MAQINVTHVHFSQSFLKQLYGGDGDPSRTVFSEGGYYFPNELEPNDPTQVSVYSNKLNLYYPRGQEELQPNGIPRAVMARNMTHKIVYRPMGTSELYDLINDPQEFNNVYYNSSYTETRLALVEMLLEWFLITGDVTPDQYDSRNVPPPPKILHV